jgi:Flp pilus assembly protein TadD
MISAADIWSDPWPKTDGADRRYPGVNEERDPDFDSAVPIQRPGIPETVTVQELSHHVPRKAEKEFEKAWKAEDKGDHEGAILRFQKAIAIDPEFRAALNDLGSVYLEVERDDLAIQEFTKAIEVDPHSSRPCSNLALAYLRTGRYGDSERAARRAIDLDSMNLHGRLVLGMALILEGRYTQETEMRLKEAAVDFPCANLWLALVWEARGDVKAAKRQVGVFLTSGEKDGMRMATALLQHLDRIEQARR